MAVMVNAKTKRDVEKLEVLRITFTITPSASHSTLKSRNHSIVFSKRHCSEVYNITKNVD